MDAFDNFFTTYNTYRTQKVCLMLREILNRVFALLDRSMVYTCDRERWGALGEANFTQLDCYAIATGLALKISEWQTLGNGRVHCVQVTPV